MTHFPPYLCTLLLWHLSIESVKLSEGDGDEVFFLVSYYKSDPNDGIDEVAQAAVAVLTTMEQEQQQHLNMEKQRPLASEEEAELRHQKEQKHIHAAFKIAEVCLLLSGDLYSSFH
jgi:hypothetical protein